MKHADSHRSTQTPVTQTREQRVLLNARTVSDLNALLQKGYRPLWSNGWKLVSVDGPTWRVSRSLARTSEFANAMITNRQDQEICAYLIGSAQNGSSRVTFHCSLPKGHSGQHDSASTMAKVCAVCGKTTSFLNENDECADCELDGWDAAANE